LRSKPFFYMDVRVRLRSILWHLGLSLNGSIG
jgi:hypothetical protein